MRGKRADASRFGTEDGNNVIEKHKSIMKNRKNKMCGEFSRRSEGSAAAYTAPEVSVCTFAMERGFALSVPTHPYGNGYEEKWFDPEKETAVGNENYREGFSF